MPDYVITPETNDPPAGTRLMEELHRKGFPVEITLKGPDGSWDSIKFFEEGREAECVLSRLGDSNNYKVSVSRDASHASLDLQLHLVEAMLREVGGVTDHAVTRERLDLKQFSLKLQAHHSGDRKATDWVWVAFAWAVALGALFAFTQVAGPNRWTVLVIALFASLSAIGLTYLQLKRE